MEESIKEVAESEHEEEHDAEPTMSDCDSEASSFGFDQDTGATGGARKKGRQLPERPRGAASSASRPSASKRRNVSSGGRIAKAAAAPGTKQQGADSERKKKLATTLRDSFLESLRVIFHFC